MSKPIAIGYLRKDLSGIRQDWHEIQIRRWAKRHGYNLDRTVVHGDWTEHPINNLAHTARRLGVEAIYTPHLSHLGGDVPTELRCLLIEVTTIEPVQTHVARTPLDPIYQHLWESGDTRWLMQLALDQTVVLERTGIER